MNTAKATAADEHAGWRADRTLCALLPAMNRRGAKVLFHQRLVRLNGKLATGAERVKPGDVFQFPDPGDDAAVNAIAKARAPRLTTPHGRQLVRIHEDDHILVINKPAEVPVHRGQGGFTRRDTLEDVLDRAYPPHPAHSAGQRGYYFVHRLDMETSGCLLIARTEAAHDALTGDFAERRMHKEYLAVVVGEVAWDKLIVRKPIAYVREDDPLSERKRWLGRRPVMRGVKKGIALEEGDAAGKPCETHFKVVARYRGYTLLRAEPRTGRTHQIRVHLTAAGCTLAYDPLYGRRTPLRFREFDPHAGESEQGEKIVLNRLPLHAWKLGMQHPATNAYLMLEAPIPRDLREFIRVLKRYRALKTGMKQA